MLEKRLDDTAETFYEGIVQVGAGAAFELDLRGNYREWLFWSLDDIGKSPTANPADAFAELFEDAVRLHMRSDVPVGVSLSGGLDSTSIMCASARIRAASDANGDLQAFCYMAPEFDETDYIMDTVRQADAMLRRLDVTAQVLYSQPHTDVTYNQTNTGSFVDLVAYYRTVLKQKGDLVYDVPATHEFDVGKFDDKTMAFPPGVTIKDFQSDVSQGFPNPRPGGQPARFPTIIQIVPVPKRP